MGSLNLITYDAKACSGFCHYCAARIDDLISQGFNLNDIEKSLRSISKKNGEMAQYDWDALEKKTINHPGYKDTSKPSITLWGADPYGSFDCLQEEVYFIEYLSKKYGKPIHIGFSTNGLAFMIPEWVEFAIKHKIGMTLSHDAIGQELRTIKPEFDPIGFAGFDELCNAHLISSVSSVLNQYNCDPVANYRWFEEKILQKYPWINIRLSKSKNGHYDVNTTNRNGFLDGNYYDELKGKPYGDMLIHNDLDNPLMAHQLDKYIDGWKEIYDNPGKYRNAWHYAVHFARLNKGCHEKNGCYKYQHGILPYSSTIDTLGNDCECMLMDSQHKSQYKGMADYCKDCKYKGRYECKECDVMEPAHADPTAIHNCKFNYRYQELMDYANAKIDFYELMENIRRGKQNGNRLRQNNNVSGNGNRRSQQTQNRLCSTKPNKGIQQQSKCCSERADRIKEQP